MTSSEDRLVRKRLIRIAEASAISTGQSVDAVLAEMGEPPLPATPWALYPGQMTPEERAEAKKTYQRSDAYKDARKKRESSEEYKAKRRAYQRSDAYKAARKKRESSEEYKAKRRAYQRSDAIKQAVKGRGLTAEQKEAKRKYQRSDAYKAKRRAKYAAANPATARRVTKTQIAAVEAKVLDIVQDWAVVRSFLSEAERRILAARSGKD